MSVKQIKLMNGEEIFCDIQEETETDLIAIGVLVLRDTGRVYHDDGLEARIFSLFPWMTYQSELKNLILISKNSVVGSMIPSKSAIEYYESSLDCLSDICEGEELIEDLKSIVLDSDRPNVVSFPSRPTKH